MIYNYTHNIDDTDDLEKGTVSISLTLLRKGIRLQLSSTGDTNGLQTGNHANYKHTQVL